MELRHERRRSASVPRAFGPGTGAQSRRLEARSAVPSQRSRIRRTSSAARTFGFVRLVPRLRRAEEVVRYASTAVANGVDGPLASLIDAPPLWTLSDRPPADQKPVRNARISHHPSHLGTPAHTLPTLSSNAPLGSRSRPQLSSSAQLSPASACATLAAVRARGTSAGRERRTWERNGVGANGQDGELERTRECLVAASWVVAVARRFRSSFFRARTPCSFPFLLSPFHLGRPRSSRPARWSSLALPLSRLWLRRTLPSPFRPAFVRTSSPVRPSRSGAGGRRASSRRLDGSCARRKLSSTCAGRGSSRGVGERQGEGGLEVACDGACDGSCGAGGEEGVERDDHGSGDQESEEGCGRDGDGQAGSQGVVGVEIKGRSSGEEASHLGRDSSPFVRRRRPLHPLFPRRFPSSYRSPTPLSFRRRGLRRRRRRAHGARHDCLFARTVPADPSDDRFGQPPAFAGRRDSVAGGQG